MPFKDQKDIDDILQRLAANQVTESERLIVSTWLDSLDEKEYRKILDQYQEIILQKTERIIRLPDLEDRIERRINLLSDSGKTVRLNKWKELAIVASMLLLAFAGAWYTLDKISETRMISPELITSQFGDDILPGREQATLTLSGGQTIILDDLAEGQLDLDDGLQITKTGDGRIAYKFTANQESGFGADVYHTISTPIGGEYQVTLPDGSRVWLNSMSAVRVPRIFDADIRNVEVTGEVYFEVAEQRTANGDKIPFLVRTANQTIEVLGTRFNIKAYPDQEAIETTLVEGKVKVKTPETSTTLSPGEQSKVEENGHIQRIRDVNVGKIIAWKNGYFQFADDSIQDIMNQLSRWYEIEVEYLDTVPESRFGGQISRSRNISEVLRILELTGEVNFQIEGRKVSVWEK